MPFLEGLASNSVITGAAVAAPGVGVTVCQATIITPGLYAVEINLMVTGTAETLLNNFLIVLAPALSTSAPSLTGVPFRFTVPRVQIPATGLIRVSAVAAATAGSVYAAYISATRIG